MILGSNITGGNAHKRRVQNYTDQHGRQWWAYVDKANGEPCGPTMPHSWQAPWFPEEKYIRRVEGRQDQIVIDYDAWIVDNDNAHRDFKREQIRAGSALHGQAYRLEHGMTPAMIEKIGMPPTSTEPIRAMKQGNKFALGLVKEVDPRLAQYMPEEDKIEEIDYRTDYTTPEETGEVEEEVIVEKPKKRKNYREAVA